MNVARTSVEPRRDVRHPVDVPVLAERLPRGDVALRLVNVSASGFMATGDALVPGARVSLRLPAVGRIEAHVVWVRDARAGFQLERMLAADEFGAMLARLRAGAAARG